MDLLMLFMLFALQSFIVARNPEYRSSDNVLPDIEAQRRTAFEIVDTAVQNKAKDLKLFNKGPVDIPKPLDCSDIYRNGERRDGLYNIWPQSRLFEGPLQVYCDMESNGGGWTVIQRRGDYGRNDTYFFKDWESYKTGFGCLLEDFWIGNDNLVALTNQRQYELRVNLTSWERLTAHASYSQFWISDESCNYTMHVNEYSGTAGDSLKESHGGSSFFTKDRNGRGCATSYKGAWWYGDTRSRCVDSNLNGFYLRGDNSKSGDGVVWSTFKGRYHSLRDSVMKIRPLRF